MASTHVAQVWALDVISISVVSVSIFKHALAILRAPTNSCASSACVFIFLSSFFGSCRCDCGPQLQKAMELIEENGKGVIVYMNQEGRGIGLINKLRAYKLQEEGLDTVEANLKLGFKMDHRDYGIGAQILRDLGVRKMKLMSNNPKKRTGIVGYGLEVTDNIPLEIESNEHNELYLKTKRDKMGHVFNHLK